MGCAPSSYPGLPRKGARGSRSAEDGVGGGARIDGPRRLSMRPHSLETRILQIDQVDTLLLDPPRSSEPEAPFVDGQLGLGDLSPASVAKFQRGNLFCDPDFPADGSALGSGQPPAPAPTPTTAPGSGGGSSSGMRWCRPAELGGAEGPVWSGDCRGRVRPGSFDDRWLAEAIAVVSQRPRLLDKVFGAEGPGAQGAVRMRLWRFGRWETVVVDDRLPAPFCISSDAEGELWPSLLEKAFAKLYGGYGGLSGGDVLWGLEDLTGGVSQRVHVPATPQEAPRAPQGVALTLGPLKVPRGRDSLYVQVFQPLVQALRYGALVSCTPVRAVRGQNQTLIQEIIVSIVVDTKLTIRGPQLCIQDDVGSPPQWWDLEDFAKAYTNIIVTTLSTESEELQVQETFGQWETGISTGGSRNNLEKFAINPQYMLRVYQPDEHEENRDFGRCSLLLALMQEHRRSTIGCKPPLLPIAYFIYKADAPGERLSAEYFLCVPEEADTGPFSNKREIAHRAELEPGNYVVIPATWSAGQPGGFLLRIFTVRKVTLEALPPYKPMCAMLPTWVPATDL